LLYKIRRFQAVLYVCFFGICSLFVAMPSYCEKKSNSSSESPYRLKKKQGLLLIKLDVEVDSAKMLVSGFSRSARPVTLDLKPDELGYMAIKIASGTYKVTEIQVPYFDLPYRVDLSGDRRWQFVIKPRQTNYLGEITVSKLRTKGTIDFRIHNRIAVDYQDYCQLNSGTCNTYPFRFAARYRDDFLAHYLGRDNNEK